MSDAEPRPATAVDDALLRSWPLPQADAAGSKNERGSVLVVAGSREMPGAAWLAAVAAFRAGAGKVTIATAASVAVALALRLPEARVVGLAETSDGGLIAPAGNKLGQLLEPCDVVLVGCGLQDTAATRALVDAVLGRRGRTALILDALAMTIAGNGRPFAGNTLLTPHAGEMAKLARCSADEVERDGARLAAESALRWSAVVALKGPATRIAAPDGRTWRHDGGEAGLAVSGSGDALAGIAAGLAARGAPLEQAAVWAVALHARAGRALARRQGAVGFLASELPAEVPRLMHDLGEVGREALAA